MSSGQTATFLTPSFGRAFIRVFLTTMLATVLGAVSDRYHSGHWWSVGYCESLAVPLLLFPTIVCLVFVPRRIRWSDTKFEIQSRFGSSQTLPWTRLYAHGSGNNVFLLQFTGVNTFQIFAGAFPRDEWQAFRSFLTASYPEKKASFWLGPKAIRWNRNA